MTCVCVCRGVEVVMRCNFIGHGHPVSSESGATVRERTGPGSDDEFLSHAVGNFILLRAGVHWSPDDFYKRYWMSSLENCDCPMQNKAGGEILTGRFSMCDDCGGGLAFVLALLLLPPLPPWLDWWWQWETIEKASCARYSASST